MQELVIHEGGDRRQVSRPQSWRSPPPLRWRDSCPSSREIIHFSFSPSSPPLISFSIGVSWSPSNLSHCYYVYNTQCDETRQKKPNRRCPGGVAAAGRRPRRGPAGPGGAKTLSRNGPTGGMSIETTGTQRFTFLRPFTSWFLSSPSPILAWRKEAGPFQHAHSPFVKFHFLTSLHERNLPNCMSVNI